MKRLIMDLLKEASEKLDDVIKDSPQLITLGEPPEKNLKRARNFIQCAITEILLTYQEVIKDEK